MEQTNYILKNIDNKLELLVTLVQQLITKKGKSKSKKTKEKQKSVKKESKTVKNVNVIKTKNTFTNSKQEEYKKKIYLARYKNGMLLHGDTFSKKEIIKKVGGIWSYNNKGWVLPTEGFDYITSKIHDLQYNRDKIFQYDLLDKNDVPYKLTSKKVEEEKVSNDIDEYYLLNKDSE